jgi:hypothetical protein
MLIQLGLEQLEQGECIGGTAGKTGQYLVFIEAPHLASVAFHHGIAHGYLAISANDYGVAPAHGQDGGASELFHCVSPE